jgi:cytochrome P450
MREDFLGLIFGGNETTAKSTVSFSYWMCLNPDILKKVRAEL